MQNSRRKFKVLCLHGYRQSDVIFREKTGGFRKQFKKYADFVFMKAPHVPVIPCQTAAVAVADGIEEDKNGDGNGKGETYGWWFSKSEKHFSSRDVTDLDTGFKESVDAVVRFAKDNGPFDGIFAFSQGAALAFLIAALRQRKEIEIDLKFMILVAGFPSLSSKHSELIRTHIENLPCLHVYGKTDEVVACENSEKLVDLFDKKLCEIVAHPGGHFVPPLSAFKENVIRFMEKIYELEESTNGAC